MVSPVAIHGAALLQRVTRVIRKGLPVAEFA